MDDITRKKAIIKRAEKLALSRYFALDVNILAQLKTDYQQALASILVLIESYADNDQLVRLQNLNLLRQDTEQALAQLVNLHRTLLNQSIIQAVQIGTQPFVSEMLSHQVEDVAQRTTRFVRQFAAADGLQLSDRLYRVSQQLKNDVVGAINQAVIQGHSASEAAADLLAAGETPSKAILDKTRRASTHRLGNVLKAQFFDDDAAYWQARRLFRTEINRAHGMAFQNALNEDEDVIGTRFKLSPNHPRKDICDMHASANLFGLGRGVYPKNKNPWPAHPNTLSYTEAVFSDEITEADRGGKESAIEWLSNQPGNVRVGVLGVYKNNLLSNNQLATWMITSRVKQLKKRFGDNVN